MKYVLYVLSPYAMFLFVFIFSLEVCTFEVLYPGLLLYASIVDSKLNVCVCTKLVKHFNKYYILLIFYEYIKLCPFLLQVSGILAPKPVSSFAHFNFDDKLMKAIRKAGYSQPTPIQAQVK